MKKVGSKDYVTENQPEYVGWYTPHAPVDWTGEVLDPKTGELVKEESLTKQSHKEECDINNIVKAFSLTGQITHLNERAAAGVYADLPDQVDYQEALNTVIQGEVAFASLPSSIRERFSNDPAEFLAFMANPDNQEEMIKLGLAVDKRPPPSTEPVVSSTPEPEKTGDK